MIIGIDLDNTIIIYDQLFCKLAAEKSLITQCENFSKKTLRDNLRLQTGGETKWMELQAQAYGQRISEAREASGFKKAISSFTGIGAQIFIISHKTRYAAADTAKKYNLRLAATKWLEDNGILNRLIPEENIFFAETRKEKISRIKKCGCDFFIDDMVEVFSEKDFPGQVCRILFCPAMPRQQGELPADCIFTDWEGIERYILNADDKRPPK